MMKLGRNFVTLLLFAFGALAQTPEIVQNGVLNAASFDKSAGAPVSPGSLVSIFGTNLAATQALNDTVPLSTSLADNVSVTFNGVTAGLDFVDKGQINAQVPWNVLADPTVAGTANVVVTRNGVASAPQAVNIAPVRPGIFSFPPGGGWAIAINNADGSLAAPVNAIPGINTHPVTTGDVLIIYATGLGAVDSAIANGADSSDKLRNTLAHPTVLVGGKVATVFFSGLTPQFPGVNQINIQVPPGVPPADQVPIQIEVGDFTTPANTFISVH
jgi:uncharacterized protein (TIGR03437 family)